MSALMRMGVNGATVDRLHLGLKEPYRPRGDGLETKDALCFPVLGEGYRPLGRYACIDLGGVTVNPQAPGGWGPGPPLVYRLGSFAPEATALVASDVVDCWLAWQLAAGGLPDVAFVSRSHPGAWPGEWRTPEFWIRFDRVVVLPGAGSADFLRDVAHLVGRSVERLVLPAPLTTIGDAALAKERPSLAGLLRDAQPWAMEPPRPPSAIPDDRLGRFEAIPIRIAGAFAGGHAYYPFATETRSVEDGEGRARLVQAYATMVLRSDGHLLTAERLPAPRGTPVDRRVLSLSDGTRIRDEPQAARCGTWSFASIQRFIAWRTAGGPSPFRPLRDLLADVEDYLRVRVWLPAEGSHLLAAMYVALSHVFQVFDAIPLLLVCGERGTFATARCSGDCAKVLLACTRLALFRVGFHARRGRPPFALRTRCWSVQPAKWARSTVWGNVAGACAARPGEAMICQGLSRRTRPKRKCGQPRAVWKGEGQVGTMNYRRAPDECYVEADALRLWAALGLAAGARGRVKRR